MYASLVLQRERAQRCRSKVTSQLLTLEKWQLDSTHGERYIVASLPDAAVRASRRLFSLFFAFSLCQISLTGQVTDETVPLFPLLPLLCLSVFPECLLSVSFSLSGWLFSLSEGLFQKSLNSFALHFFSFENDHTFISSVSPRTF